MKHRATLAVAITTLMLTATFALPVAAQHTPDANTVLLDAFDGVTQGEEHGTISYAPSLPALGQAVDLEPGDWLKYAVPPWAGQQGTIEAWIYPDTYGYSIALLQWFNTNTNPPAGYIGHFSINPNGHLQWGSWGPPWCGSPAPIGSSVVALEEWTHVAATWSPAGTRLYINGVLDFVSGCNHAPALWINPTYVYVNGWGDFDHGLMDEFRISSVPRSEEEIRGYVLETLTIPVDIDIKPGSFPNSINPEAKGLVPVAILGSATFDVSDVDAATVFFGPDGATPLHRGGHLEDVNGDGYTDLMFHFKIPATGLASGDTEACLDGMTTGGVPINGCDSVNTVP